MKVGMINQQESWEKEFNEKFSPGKIDWSTPLTLQKELRDYIRNLLTKQKEEMISEQYGDVFKETWMNIGQKIGRQSLKAELCEKLEEKKFKVAKTFDTETHAGYFYKGYNSSVADLLSLLDQVK